MFARPVSYRFGRTNTVTPVRLSAVNTLFWSYPVTVCQSGKLKPVALIRKLLSVAECTYLLSSHVATNDACVWSKATIALPGGAENTLRATLAVLLLFSNKPCVK